MTDLREAEEISTGELLDGRYRLDARIGEGGMARVYRAHDTHLHRTIAVKVLRGPMDGPQTLERARAETRVLASLNHHSIVTVLDARISDADGSYIVMEYVEGITLRELIHRGPVDERDVARIAVDVAEGLHVAHRAGIVHRDVKPGNVLLRPSPVPGPTWHAKLADFGIAFLLDSTRVTTPGLVMGTVAYIAPEQAQGAPPAPPADIYALGIMLIEALTGERPYPDAEGIGALTARLLSPPPIPESLSPEWQGLLRGMTAMRADDRPTALEVATVASRLAAAGTVANVDRPTEAVEMPTQPTMLLPAPNPAVVGAAGVAGAAAAGAAAVGPAGTAGASSAASGGSGAGAAAVPATRAANRRRAATPAAAREPATARRRRRVALAVLVGVLCVIALVTGIWTMSLAGTPEPEASRPPVVPSVVPSETPSETPIPAPPAPVVDQDRGEESGNGNQGEGNGNEGEENGNGNGNGNEGTGNQGNGNEGNGGEGNSDQGNGRGNGNEGGGNGGPGNGNQGGGNGGPGNGNQGNDARNG